MCLRDKHIPARGRTVRQRAIKQRSDRQESPRESEPAEPSRADLSRYRSLTARYTRRPPARGDSPHPTFHLLPRSRALPARDLRSRHRGCGRLQRRSPSEQVLLKSASATARVAAREWRARSARLGSDALGARDSAHARGIRVPAIP